MKVSVIVPTKDEPRVGELIKAIHKALDKWKHEVIIVDKSASPPSVGDALIIRQKSNGVGKAILEGFENSSGDVIVMMNGDFSHDPRDLCCLLRMITECDIVIGSRYVPGGRSSDTLYRKFVSQAFRFLAKSILGLSVADPLSGFSALRPEVLSSLSLNPIGFKIMMETLYKVKGKHLRTVEVPIVFNKRRFGRSKAGVAEGLRTLLFIIKLRLEHYERQ